MANAINGRVWTLDTVVGLVTRDPVFIKGILVTWKVGSAGALLLSEIGEGGDEAAGMTILDTVTAGATSAAVDQLSQWFPVEGNFHGLKKVTMTDIAKLAVYIK